ncbi:cytochrome P450 [Pseudomassariella vexata]|uniref:Cytochrome P450 n=1 Tax=Pseudomassariella vexata TaxID=1141098 RepID=A0A1Y2DTA4_9PEZI|nr:cytochrome P450 [Pseudomassariella vexata]ORY62503.1 cytochrome P450 [Pseudomassariella vexata]
MAAISVSDVATPAISLLILASLYRYVLYPVVFSPLSKIPNAHWSCSISPFWILWARYESRENRTLYEAHDKHGPIVRISPTEISINSMEGVKIVYQGGFDKHEWYDIFNNYGVPCMFSSTHAKEHSIRKRMVSNVYSKSYIHSSASLAAQSYSILNSRFIPTLEHSVFDSQKPHGIDVYSLFCATAMDFISTYCFGLRNSSNFIQNKLYRDHWLKLYQVRKGYGFFPQELPRLSRAVTFIGLHLTPTWVDAANDELEAWCKKLSNSAVSYLKKTGTESQDSVDDPVVVRSLLAGIDKEEKTNGKESPIYPTAILQQELSVASEVIDHVLAGQETTGVTLTYLTWHLSQSLDLQHELRNELRSLEPNMRLEAGRVNIADSKQLDNLPILHAVITETVRKYAPAGGPEPRIAPSPSSRIGPYEVPGGTRVSASAYNLHRDKKFFPDPEKWDHARWLQQDGVDGEKKTEINRQFWGFSSGGRMCLGSNFAMHEMKLIIAAIYSNYTSHIVDDEGIEPTDGYTAHPKSDQLWLRFEKV